MRPDALSSKLFVDQEPTGFQLQLVAECLLKVITLSFYKFS